MFNAATFVLPFVSFCAPSRALKDSDRLAPPRPSISEEMQLAGASKTYQKMITTHPHLKTSEPRGDEEPQIRTLQAIRASPVILCLRHNDPERTFEVACAAIHGGVRVIEVTFTTPRAAEILYKLRDKFPHVTVGAGTVLTENDVRIAADAGAAFVMSPGTDIEIVRQAEASSMLAIPGAATPTEICHAYYRAGARVVKLFPVMLCGGLEFIRAIQGPLGHIPLVPTSGISTDLIEDFLSEPNVLAISTSRQIVHPAAFARCDWDDIAHRAKFWTTAAANCRPR